MEYIQEMDLNRIMDRYREIFEQLCKLDTTDKQAMAMSCMLLADEIAVKLFFPEERALQVSQVKQYLQSNFDVDVAERATSRYSTGQPRTRCVLRIPRRIIHPIKGKSGARSMRTS